MIVAATVPFIKKCFHSCATHLISIFQFLDRFYQSLVYYLLRFLQFINTFFQSLVYYLISIPHCMNTLYQSLDIKLIIRYFISFIRKTLVLGIIFSLSLLYCVISFMSMPGNGATNEMNMLPARKLDDSFLWHSNDENNDTVLVTTCRNSVQGRFLIVDDKGYVCNRLDEILANGCCNASLPHVAEKRYSCETCKENGCCSIYEYCISCCLHPDKKDLLQNVLGKAPDTFRVLFASVTDHFELCLAKCRTSSQSVQHENSYKDPRAKHCYGDNPPSTDSATA